MGGGAADGDAARGAVVDVGHRCSGAAGHALGGTKAVGVASGHRHGLTHLSLGEHEGAGGGAADGCACGAPLVADGAQAVEIGQGVVHRQGLPLGGGAADGDAARGQGVS